MNYGVELSKSRELAFINLHMQKHPRALMGRKKSGAINLSADLF
jgi:hypothetical protein